MGQRAAAGIGSQGCALARMARRCLDVTLNRSPGLRSPLATLLVLAGLTVASPGRAQDLVKGEATFTAPGGYARLVLKLAEDVESDVITAGSIIVIRFKRPVDIPVDKLSDAVPDYVGSARRDPDGSAIRLSLARRATINTMTAGERIFVDFLPDSWTGPPPTLPADVIRELAARARAAERALRAQLAVAAAKKKPPVRVRASVQPTFVRFVFEMPNGVNVSSVLNEQKLTLQFNGVLAFDLADAKVAAPPNIASITQRTDGDSSAVDIVLIGEVDVHSFREEKNYVIDVAFQQADKPAAEQAQAPAVAPPAVVHGPAARSGISAQIAAAQAGAHSKPLSDSIPPQHPPQLPPVTSEAIAEQAKIEIRPGEPQEAPPAIEKAPPAAETAPRASEKMVPVVEQPAPVAEKPAPQVAVPAPAVEKLPAVPQKAELAAEKMTPVETPKAAAASEAKPAAAIETPKPAAPKKAASAVEAPKKTEPPAASVEARRDSDGLRVMFSFAVPTPAAMFRRADTVWLVFDQTGPIDVEQIRAKGGAIIGDVSQMPLEKGQAIRIRLNRPQMPSLESDGRANGMAWTLTFADRVQAPPLPLQVLRNITDPALANVTVPLANPGLMHRLVDPDAGDTLLVVTAPPPTRGFIKRQDFVELSLLESVHGVVVHPNSDDITAEVGSDKVMLGRPGGLTLSSADVSAERATAAVRPLFDAKEWRKNREENFLGRLDALIKAVAVAGDDGLAQARLDLANFYMARGMFQEARGVTNLILSESKAGSEDAAVVMVNAVASILIGHPERGLKGLASPVIGNGYDSQLWKALAFARQGKWADAREKFKNAEFSIAALPPEMQRILTVDAMRAALEVKDYAGASRRRSELEVVGVPKEMKPEIAVLRGRLAEALGHDKDALDAYRFAANSSDRPAAAEARLLEVLLRQRRGQLGQAEVLRELETLSAIWRGDAIELKTLAVLSQLYADEGHYEESLAAAKTATRLQPNSELARQGQDAASALFAQLFLSPKGEDMKPIDALGMFYEYRELTPIGRRGDEMIRRLADRLVAVDLLDQAAELLQYQIDKRLEGAARAQVAARLAMVYLTNRKPDRAVAALRTTRIADLSGELRQQRLLLEARAQSDVGRHDLALDIISNITGREAIRLRSDIYWASRQWREASEQIELYYADRWRDFKPLNAVEKGDVIRAVVGYALAEDAIGLSRFREKYAPLMLGDTDRMAFDLASKPAAGSSTEFAAIAKMAAGVDTLDGFIREMKVRFPDATARAPISPEMARGEPVHTGALPAISGHKSAEATK
ncbi:tetratricopeptide repeat protein [Bradyrhizobium sp. AUGA SZCCT0240]|uniref:tetratricopeptide repeat protein n=1 Tax=unclassified Bradyrhizobium TaxID=2631580 RepID=UPI001BA8656A|nr:MULTISPECIES: tetratricopeptide repeat protein [unclassified Bradyrhizobium]MBR1199136.1 tetratricopeptide repeat protein [Bradyrhizobium sp. AUGA SZCCT0158]MBR1238678.1 tetratricopeptide repeat protein [Bradyrhizobium sp. AUGA SZCCT0274]MBR1253582.1 tetratricopeptide repeat protein [Bradyrhizobium sp. AUGA SZCCT0240]